MPTNAVVCLPTYNERENLEPMVRALADHGVKVLVIDDNSPDGTGEIADRLAAELEWVEVLHRPRKEGLGRAYVDGFRHVLASGAELVLEMDCDFSHDPADVPRLIAAVENGADLALGSRYVEGGGTTDWGLVRRLISRGASIYTRVLLMPIHDATGGFKCFRRARPRVDRPRHDRRCGLRLSDRDDVSRATQGVPRRGSSHPLCRPHRRHVEDEPGDRARGRSGRSRRYGSQR